MAVGATEWMVSPLYFRKTKKRRFHAKSGERIKFIAVKGTVCLSLQFEQQM
jgi:hypothetical protein